MPGGGFVTNEIKLPENWNELVAPLGYEPIEIFYISGKFNVDGNDGTEKIMRRGACPCASTSLAATPSPRALP